MAEPVFDYWGSSRVGEDKPADEPAVFDYWGSSPVSQKEPEEAPEPTLSERLESLHAENEKVLAQPDEEDDGGVLQDLAASFGMGANALLEGVGTLYGLASGDMDNWAREQGASGRAYYEDWKSEELTADEQARAAKIAAADGIAEEAWVAFWETVSNPRLLSTFVAEQLPMFVPGMAGGRVAGWGASALGASAKTAGKVGTGVAIGSGAALQGADAGGDTYDEIMKLPDAVWEKNDEYQTLRQEIGEEAAKEEIALNLSRISGAGSAAISLLANTLPGSRIFDRFLGGAASKTKGPWYSRMAKGALGEGASEAVDEGGGAFSRNLAVGTLDETREWHEGVGEAAGLGAASAVFGGATGLLDKSSDIDERDKSKIRDAQERINPLAPTDQELDARILDEAKLEIESLIQDQGGTITDEQYNSLAPELQAHVNKILGLAVDQNGIGPQEGLQFDTDGNIRQVDVDMERSQALANAQSAEEAVAIATDIANARPTLGPEYNPSETFEQDVANLGYENQETINRTAADNEILEADPRFKVSDAERQRTPQLPTREEIELRDGNIVQREIDESYDSRSIDEQLAEELRYKMAEDEAREQGVNDALSNIPEDEYQDNAMTQAFRDAQKGKIFGNQIKPKSGFYPSIDAAEKALRQKKTTTAEDKLQDLENFEPVEVEAGKFVLQRKGAEVQQEPEQLTLLSPLTEDEIETEGGKKPVFYSAVARGSKNLQIGKKGMPAEQLINTLKKQANVREEEIEWMGLEDWAKEKGKVTREELDEFIAQNQVVIEEKKHGNRMRELHETFVNDGFVELDDGTYMERGRNDSRMITWYNEDGSEIRRYNSITSALDDAQDSVSIDGATQYAEYQLPGGKNYGELLLTLPNGVTDPYKSNHWSEDNVLAHIRYNERNDTEGNRTLVIEEIQSDWHQDARRIRNKEIERVMSKDGLTREEAEKAVPKDFAYDTEPASKPVWTVQQAEKGWQVYKDGEPVGVPYMREQDAVSRADYNNEAGMDYGPNGHRVPNAPFKDSATSKGGGWGMVAFKRMLRHAVDNGYDQISWTPGTIQADRYNLSNKVDKIEVHGPFEAGMRRVGIKIEGLNTIQIAVDDTGMITDVGHSSTINADEWKGKDIGEVVGRKLADKIMQTGSSGTGFRIAKFTNNDPGMLRGRSTLDTVYTTRERAEEHMQILKETAEASGLTTEYEIIEEASVPAEISGEGLDIGGSGMKGFYDKILPSAVKSYVKRLGGELSTQSFNVSLGKRKQAASMTFEQWLNTTHDLGIAEIMISSALEEKYTREYDEYVESETAGEEQGTEFWTIKITDEMRQKAGQPQPMFTPAKESKPLDKIRFKQKAKVEGSDEVVEYTASAQDMLAELDDRVNALKALRQCVA